MQKGPRVDSRFSRGAHVEILFSCFLPSFFFFRRLVSWGCAECRTAKHRGQLRRLYNYSSPPTIMGPPSEQLYARKGGAECIITGRGVRAINRRRSCRVSNSISRIVRRFFFSSFPLRPSQRIQQKHFSSHSFFVYGIHCCVPWPAYSVYIDKLSLYVLEGCWSSYKSLCVSVSVYF